VDDTAVATVHWTATTEGTPKDKWGSKPQTEVIGFFEGAEHLTKPQNVIKEWKNGKLPAPNPLIDDF
jgi:hypothetical protein